VSNFPILAAPVLERIEFSGGYSQQDNTNYVTVGREETKQVALRGTHFNSVVGKSPVCMFSHLYSTTASVIDDY